MSDFNLFSHYAGLTIYVDDELMSTPARIWSKCRSPARAQRRARRGFPQHDYWVKIPRTDILRIGNKAIMHSTMRARLLEATTHE